MQTDNVLVNPEKVLYADKTAVSMEFVAQGFCEIFGLDYTETLEELNSATKTTKIVSKVETDKIAKLEQWLKDNNIVSGITAEDTIKRYYPYNTLASNLIGFTGTDNTGLMGLEYSLNSILAGTNGKKVTLTDSVNDEIPNQEQTYIAAQNGQNVYLTIDVTIQSITEKYLSQAVIDNKADSGTIIIMQPSTGDILSMASYPTYNLNSPYTITDSSIQSIWDTLTADEKNNIYYQMWNNTAVQKTYEPGSTFKIINASTALEENIVETDHIGDFYCSGYETINNQDIRCWKYYAPHQALSLRTALANSCNPAFIQLGREIGKETLYKYYKAFGLFDKTNPEYFYGEENSVFYNIEDINEIELATMSFGQRFTLTPIQLITAISAIANEGTLMKPRIVKQIVDTDNNSITTVEPTAVREVLSKETCEKMLDMLEYVVTNGTGKYAAVSGYSIGGKSGTTEPLDNDENSVYIASFIGLAPASNPDVVVLVILNNPKGEAGHQGGTIAAPVVSQILSEILPYLGIASTNSASTTTNSSLKTVTLPDVRNLTVEEAKKSLEGLGFTVHLPENYDVSDIVTDQTPKTGVTLYKNSHVFLYTDKSSSKTYTSVPNFKGMTTEAAINSASSKNLNVAINGSGIVISQDIASASNIEEGSIITLTLQNEIESGY